MTVCAMVLTMLGWDMPSVMDASRGSPSLMMMALRSSMTCTQSENSYQGQAQDED